MAIETSPIINTNSKVAIIGAGISGLAAASGLLAARVKVTVFDKGRGVAGRMSARRHANGLSFDHGAQYFTVRDERFETQVAKWIESGVAATWAGRIGILDSGKFTLNDNPQQRFVGVPGMNQLCVELAKGIDVRSHVVVASVERVECRWRLSDDQHQELGQFDFLISSAPAAQTAALLGDATSLQPFAAQTRMTACWAVMLAFDDPLDLGFDGAFVEASPLSWIARNSSKPGRSSQPETWVLHASPEWSERHVEDDSDVVLPMLIDAFWDATGATRRVTAYAAAHRWRYALPPDPLKEHYLLDRELHLAACGDWCGGPRVEGAYLSGVRLVDRLLGEA